MQRTLKQSLLAIPPWIILGALALLTPIFLFWTLHSINKQKEDMIRLLTEKGAALIRSFEAGTRTGMMGMMGRGAGDFRLQHLLSATSEQPDILYLLVADEQGEVIAHSDPAAVGGTHGTELNLKRLSELETVEWRQISDVGGSEVFEVFRRFTPTRPPPGGREGRFRGPRAREFPDLPLPDRKQIIFVGLDMAPLEEARKEDMHHSLLMGSALLLIGFAGVVLLSLAQAYRTARTSLSRVQAFSDRVVENMPVGLIALDENQKVVSLNRAAEEILHQDSGDVVGRPSAEILPGQIVELSSGLKPGGQEMITDELECRLSDGRTLFLDLSVSLIHDNEGKRAGRIVLFRDLTEVQTLKKEVETSRRLASLGRLAAGIAHEIRNPLSSIKGFATYFREKYKDNRDDRDTADTMITEVDRLNRVISQLLDFTRPVSLHMKRIPVQTLVQHSLRMIERQASSGRIDIRVDFAPSLGDVEVDFDKITQVLLNLYLNALDAMDQGGTLSVSCKRNAGDQWVRISVEDTGCGIDREHLEHVFDPYFTTKQTGTGLGLAIVQKIVQAHGGEVKAKSEAGRGTAVTVTLPV